MECKSSPLSSCNLCFDPLSKSDTIDALTTLTKVVKTCIGPRGKLKVIRSSSGGHTTVTSSSQRLFQCISIKNFLLKLIISSVKTQLKVYSDGGLQCAFLALTMIKNALPCGIPLPSMAALYDHFINTYLELLKCESNRCILRFDFTNLEQLQSLIRSLISSKPGCLLSQNHKDHIGSLLLKAFLEILPSTSKILDNYNLRFLTLEGADINQSKLFQGLLVRVSKIDWALLLDLRHEAKVALFTTSLSGDLDFPVQNLEVSGTVSVHEAILEYLQAIAAQLILEKVDLVICQKVVHPKLKKQLNDAGVAVFDQIGCETAGYLQYLLGDSCNSSLFMELTFGTVTCSKEKIGKNHYILLQTDLFPFCSLLICNYNEESLSELRVVCQQAISMLFRLMKNPKICFGSGCTVVSTALSLASKINRKSLEISIQFGCNRGVVLTALHSFLTSIADVALATHQGSRLDFVTETIHGHLWGIREGNYPSKNDTCACGRYAASDVAVSSWSFLSDIENMSSSFDPGSLHDSISFRNVILDELDCKVSCFLLGTETATLLLKTTLCIFSETVNNDR